MQGKTASAMCGFYFEFLVKDMSMRPQDLDVLQMCLGEFDDFNIGGYKSHILE